MKKTKMKAASMSPRNASGERKVIKLARDNISFGDVWILTDGHRVSIHQQKVGQSPTQGITLPIRKFNKLIDWYVKPQRLRR